MLAAAAPGGEGKRFWLFQTTFLRAGNADRTVGPLELRGAPDGSTLAIACAVRSTPLTPSRRKNKTGAVLCTVTSNDMRSDPAPACTTSEGLSPQSTADRAAASLARAG